MNRQSWGRAKRAGAGRGISTMRRIPLFIIGQRFRLYLARSRKDRFVWVEWDAQAAPEAINDALIAVAEPRKEGEKCR
jgi:hypothetical protein